ncbi:glycosyl hydrolase family 18 protein [Nocardioides sp. GY 10127]|uniref:glycosyl hydrolase family 18 protein n=1 Tax=Nocardioides sp. GY 10127 TaxID=2569762 RepID=UPI001458E548|nr:glycosyl hydrolase family 18 protein [Nocardioides sp. GY 10127]
MNRRPSRPSALLLAGLLSALLWGTVEAPGASLAAVGAQRDRASASPAVTGYAIPSVRSRVVRRDAAALSTVTVASIGLTASGDGLATPSKSVRAGLRRLRRTAHAEGLSAQLILSNYREPVGFDARAQHRLLHHPAHRAAVASSAARTVRRAGWDGLNVDLERVRAADAAGLVSLLRELRGALPSTAALTVDVSARTSLRSYRAAGYRLRRIAGIVDVVQLMAYDQHGPTWTGPGPVGSLVWQRAALRAARRAVPARRLDLGVAGYGYTWPPESSGRTGTSISPASARRRVERAGVTPRWHRRDGEWSATLPGGTVLWWSDARSVDARLALAARRGLHGVALWRLGTADPLVGRQA